jgi:hypothetical protein
MSWPSSHPVVYAFGGQGGKMRPGRRWLVPAPEDLETVPRDRTVSGVMLALLGHTLTLAPLIEHALLRPHSRDGAEFIAFLAGQVIVLVFCVGAALRRRGPERSGFGRGLVIGWLAGLIWTPVMAVIISYLDLVASHDCCY